MVGEHRWYSLPRLVDRVYFGTHLYRFPIGTQAARRQPTRYDRLRLQYGPSRHLILIVWALWLSVALAALHLFVIVKPHI